MSVKDRYTAIADALRKQYGTTDKYKLADMPKMIEGLEIENLLDPGQSYDSKSNPPWGITLTGMNLDKLNKLAGKTITLSFDVSWSGFDPNNESNKRFGMEYGFTADDGKQVWPSAWVFVKDTSGKSHASASIYIPNKKYTRIQEGALYNQINSGATVKFTNPKIVVNPVGGVVPPDLFDGLISFEPVFVKQQGSLYSFAALHYDGQYRALLFTNDKIDLSSCSHLRLSFRAKGEGSVWTYLFGNNYNGTYVDNGKEWHLTNTWQEFSQDFSRETIPLNSSFSFRTLEHNSGEVTDLKLIKLK